MSNTVTRKTTLTNGPVLRRAIDALDGEYLGVAEQRFYNSRAFGHRIKLPGFGGTIVVDTDGLMHFDEDYLHSGRAALDGLLQQYAVSAAEEIFEPKGYVIEKEKLDNGSIKMTLTLGGGYGSVEGGEDTQEGYGVG